MEYSGGSHPLRAERVLEILATGVLPIAAKILLFVASRQHHAHGSNASVGMRE
jgi:hypothetical protein